MVKYKNRILIFLIFFFLAFSFYPTYFELKLSKKLADRNREFILEHNYYWPDFNLYLSKIRQGWEGNLLPQEKYTTEAHKGSLIQSFYAFLGLIGKNLALDPNFSYQLGRIILSPILLLVILLFVRYYFRSSVWQIIALIIILVSGSFPKIISSLQGIEIDRYMDWWSNIDALQRITFIPHILFGQVVSFYLLYQLTIKPFNHLTIQQLLFYIFLGNLTGLVFPPSLITLNGVILLLFLIQITKQVIVYKFEKINTVILNTGGASEGSQEARTVKICEQILRCKQYLFQERLPRKNCQVFYGDRTRKLLIFMLFTLPSLLYLLLITKQIPWSGLVDFHRIHPMMIPLDQYILGTGPIFFLGAIGALVSIIKRDKKYQPLILWILVTFLFAVFFSIVKEQSPLRFTQTGLFIPLGILGAYLLLNLSHLRYLGYLSHLLIILYILGSIFMMTTSLKWQTTFIRQRVGASIPPVPYPPQTMYPLKEWMDGIRWLRDKTDHNDMVLAEITAGNFIPAYAGNFVYFGQSNTVDYDRKQKEAETFFRGKMSPTQAEIFFKNGRIKYVFFSIQEKEKSGGTPLEKFYPFLKSVYNNNSVIIYVYQAYAYQF